MLIEARRYRLALVALCRNGGTVPEIARAVVTTQGNVRRLLEGEFAFLTAVRARRIEALLSEPAREWVQESPRWELGVGHVPTELVAPLIQEAYARYGRPATAEMVGVFERQLFGVAVERNGVTFAAADRIVTKLAGPGWWRESPARLKWYWGTNRVFGRAEAVKEAAKKARWRARRRELAAV